MLYMLSLTLEVRYITKAINTIGPLLLGFGTFWLMYRILRRDTLEIWTPFFWFLFSTIVYWSIGPLIYPFGSDEIREIDYRAVGVVVSDHSLTRTNLLCVASTLVVSSAYLLVRLRLPSRASYASVEARLGSIKTATMLMLVSGEAIQFLLVLPYKFGNLGFQLPGIVMAMEGFVLLGLLGLAYLAVKCRGFWRLAFIVLTSIQVIISIAMFSKSALVMALLLPSLGAFLAHNNRRKLIASLALTAVAFFSSANLVEHGRGQILLSTGNISQASLEQRLNIISEWIMNDKETRVNSYGDSSWQKAWVRMSYTSVQTFAMKRFDSAQPGHTYEAVFIALIPRILWPDKPNMSNYGKEFHKLVTGNYIDSFLGLGIYGEAYWNAGWIGVVIVGTATGVILGMLSYFSHAFMSRLALIYLPSVLIGIKIGLYGPVLLFSTSILPEAVYYFIFYLFFRVFYSLFLVSFVK